MHRGGNTRCELRQLVSSTCESRNCSSSMDCNNEATQASTRPSLSKEQETSPNCFELHATVSASIHRRGFSRSSLASDNLNANFKCLGSRLQLTPQQTTRSRTGLSEMHPSLNASFNSLDRLRAITPDALTGTFAPKPETASLDHVVGAVHVKISFHQYHPSRLVRSRRSHRPSALHASFHRRQAVHYLRLRYHVRVCHSRLPC